MIICLFLSTAVITPGKKVDEGILADVREEGKKDEAYEQA